jgi:hypothetical protein
MILMSLTAGCQINSAEPTAKPIKKKSEVTGRFVMYGFGLGGQNLEGTFDVKELADGSFSVEWTMKSEERYRGKGSITEDGKFFVVYTGSEEGDGTWELMSNNELHGKWHPKDSDNYGIEVWSREPVK